MPGSLLNGAKPQRTCDSILLGLVPWQTPSNMIGRMVMPFSLFALPRFRQAGHGAMAVISANSGRMGWRVNVVPRLLPGTQGTSFRHKHFNLMARNIP